MQAGLVIFDCDGVLVDSEPISASVLVEVLAESGLQLDRHTVYDRFLGRSMTDIAAILRDEFDFALAGEEFDDLRGCLFSRLREELAPVPRVAEVLPLFPRRCVASSSQPERIRMELEVTGLLAFFEPRVYSASMVENGKPAPDLFLHAACAMGAAPEQCVVIEDSPAGIEAARRAGMRVLAFVGAGHAAPAGLADRVAKLAPDAIFDDMRELPRLLADVGLPLPSR